MSESPLPAANAPALHVRFDETVPILEIPPALAFDQLRLWVRDALPERLPDLNGRTCRLDFGERELQLFDLRRLIHLLRDEFSIDISGLYVRAEAIQRYAERELKLKLFPTDDVVPVAFTLPVAPEPTDDDLEHDADAHEDADSSADALTEIDGDAVSEDSATEVDADDELEGDSDEDDDQPLARLKLPTDLEPGDLELPTPAFVENIAEDLASEAPRRNAPDHGRRTFTVHRTLRSGAVVRFDGDLIVFGDVNPGANVIATGNVVVLGALKGMAHAGASGDETRSILAFDFRPTQVRIGKKIAMPPSNRSDRPELVVVRHDEIVIEPYQGRI